MKLENGLVKITANEILAIISQSNSRDEDVIEEIVQLQIEKPAYELAGKEWLHDSIYDVFADVDLLRDTVRDYVAQ